METTKNTLGGFQHDYDIRYSGTKPIPCSSHIRPEARTYTQRHQCNHRAKIEHARVLDLPTGKKRFAHMQRSLGYYKGIFTFRASWDYILTFVNESTGYLISKDDIPAHFWHTDCSDKDYLQHDFDSTWLDRRCISLVDPADTIVAKICGVLKGDGASLNTPPQRASLTPQDIVRTAGACPVSLLWPGRRRGEVFDDDIDLDAADTGIQPTNVAGADPEDNPDAVLEVDQATGSTDWQGPRWTTAEPGRERVKIQGGREFIRDAQLATQIMQQCRDK